MPLPAGAKASSGPASSSLSPEEGPWPPPWRDQVDPDTAARRVELVVDLQSRVMDEYNESVWAP